MNAKVTVVGTGYVGLTTGACLAALGHTVTCADIDPAKVAKLQCGEIPILEEGLAELVQTGLSTGRLSFVVGAAKAVIGAEYIFMCLPTPQGADGQADLSFLMGAAAEIGPMLRRSAVVINKSTVPVGSAQAVAEQLGRSDVFVASNPEFLREGSAVQDFFNPDRVVTGSNSEMVGRQVASLYDKLNAPKLLVDTQTAEMIKYGANAFLAAKLSFVNDLANLSAMAGADAGSVLSGIGLDPRIGAAFMQHGPGWGGSCFPKDTVALAAIAENVGYDFPLLRAVIESNDTQLSRMTTKVAQLLGGNVAGKKIAAWGLSFKANTDDTRQSPAIKILSDLADAGAYVHAYDPKAQQGIPYNIKRHHDALSVCDDAEVLVVLTEWSEFAAVPLAEVAARMANRRVLDTRNLLDAEVLRQHGFSYELLGREANVSAVVV